MTFVEVPMATVGSLSYAEDDDRHYLGVKAAVVSKDGRSQFCCHILECNNEVYKKQINLTIFFTFISLGNC